MIAGGVAVAGLAFFYLYGKGRNDSGGGFFQDIGAGAGSAVVDVVDGVISGGAIAIGDKIGIPKTNLTECERALAEGRTWDASFACPAGKFIGSFF